MENTIKKIVREDIQNCGILGVIGGSINMIWFFLNMGVIKVLFSIESNLKVGVFLSAFWVSLFFMVWFDFQILKDIKNIMKRYKNEN